MFGRHVRLAALATTAAGALLLAGCSAGDQANAPPPRSDYRADSSAPDLMGAAPPPNASQAQDGLLGGPVAAAGDTSVSSRPLPPPPARNSHLKTWRRPDGTLVTAMRPIANPKGSTARAPAHAKPRVYAAYHPAAPVAHPAAKPVAHPAPKPAVVATAKPPIVAKPVTPKTVAPAPAPVQAAKPVLPAKPLAKPPVVAAAPAAPAPAPVAAKPATKLEKLQAAVAPEATNGAVLAAGESLGKNQPGQVTLSLPATLGDLIKQEAAKLGLTKAAKKTSAYAELSGEGYEVTPNGRQTAVVKPGEPTTFAWQVKPGPDAKGQLKSDFGVELNGAKQPQGFALGTISKRVAALPEKVKKGFGDLDLGALNGKISLPGLGDVPLKTVLGVALVLLALIILVGVSRNASEARRKAERQRKYRTLTDYGRNEMEFDDPKPSSAHVSYVNPFVAAAGGAAAGAAAMHVHDTHQADHGHGHDDHGHGHDDHGHAAHDGHGHDLHAEAHPEPHAPAEHVSYANPFMANTSGHDDHGHDNHGHGHDSHGHDAHHGDHGSHDPHHAKEPEHAH
jgi:Na+-transporting methylmalonyl-CoA/oxaloacetate decarboxylase gamma subunit